MYDKLTLVFFIYWKPMLNLDLKILEREPKFSSCSLLLWLMSASLLFLFVQPYHHHACASLYNLIITVSSPPWVGGFLVIFRNSMSLCIFLWYWIPWLSFCQWHWLWWPQRSWLLCISLSRLWCPRLWLIFYLFFAILSLSASLFFAGWFTLSFFARCFFPDRTNLSCVLLVGFSHSNPTWH